MWSCSPARLLYNDFACTIFAWTPVTASFIKKLASFWSVFELISLTRSLLLRCLIYIPGLVVDSKEVKPVKYLFLWVYQEHSLSYTSYCIKVFLLILFYRLCILFQPFGRYKVEKILKGSLDLISSPSPPVKIQIMGNEVCLMHEGKTLLGIFNKLFVFKSLLTISSNVLPLQLSLP